MIPSFITTICARAFMFKSIRELTLSKGLKHIGSDAFGGNAIKHVEIPETVQFICQGAFEYNEAVISKNNKQIYHMTNPNTLIID